MADDGRPGTVAADLVIATLAQSEAALQARIREREEQIVDLTLDCESYRTLAVEAIHQLAALTKQHTRSRETAAVYRDELRRYTRNQIAEAA